MKLEIVRKNGTVEREISEKEYIKILENLAAYLFKKIRTHKKITVAEKKSIINKMDKIVS